MADDIVQDYAREIRHIMEIRKGEESAARILADVHKIRGSDDIYRVIEDFSDIAEHREDCVRKVRGGMDEHRSKLEESGMTFENQSSKAKLQANILLHVERGEDIDSAKKKARQEFSLTSECLLKAVKSGVVESISDDWHTMDNDNEDCVETDSVFDESDDESEDSMDITEKDIEDFIMNKLSRVDQHEVVREASDELFQEIENMSKSEAKKTIEDAYEYFENNRRNLVKSMLETFDIDEIVREANSETGAVSKIGHRLNNMRAVGRVYGRCADTPRVMTAFFLLILVNLVIIPIAPGIGESMAGIILGAAGIGSATEFLDTLEDFT